MTLYFFAFLAGVVMIFSPCIWPLLPIILSSGATGGPRKPLGIVAGLSVSFLFVTLLLTALLRVFPVDPEIFRTASVVVIIFLGLTLLIPFLNHLLEGFLSRLSASFGPVKSEGTGFSGGFLTGGALGIVWSPCAGPVLATVATVAATQGVNTVVFLTAVFFILGVSVPLFIIAFLGQRAFAKMRLANKYTGRIQQAFGVIIVLTGVLIYTGYDRVLQTKILESRSGETSWIGAFEKSDFLKEKLEALRSKDTPGGNQKESKGNEASIEDLGTAPEFTDIESWLNTDNGQELKMADLRGKVVLIDFWTYSCINCIRTLPYVTAWYERYKDDGFVVVGVHTPEFAFEKKKSNVEAAIAQYNIGYPVAQDNNYGTWQAYKNQYWPAHYLIDKDGVIRYTHFGEGKYDVTEKMIQTLLKEAGQQVDTAVTRVEAEAPGSGKQTKETYLGADRMERFYSAEAPVIGTKSFSYKGTSFPQHFWGYQGEWTVLEERSVASKDATLGLQFQGKKVFLVMSAGAAGTEVEVLMNGKVMAPELAGKDVQGGKVRITEERLYELVKSDRVESGFLELRFLGPGVSVYAFTFS